MKKIALLCNTFKICAVGRLESGDRIRAPADFELEYSGLTVVETPDDDDVHLKKSGELLRLPGTRAIPGVESRHVPALVTPREELKTVSRTAVGGLLYHY